MKRLVVLTLIAFSCGGFNNLAVKPSAREELKSIQKRYEEYQVMNAKRQTKIDSLRLLINQLDEKEKK